jgi:hypothetical protein
MRGKLTSELSKQLLSRRGIASAIHPLNGDKVMNLSDINSVDTSGLLKNIESILQKRNIHIPDNSANDLISVTEKAQAFPLIDEKSDTRPALGRHVNIWV